MKSPRSIPEFEIGAGFLFVLMVIAPLVCVALIRASEAVRAGLLGRD